MTKVCPSCGAQNRDKARFCRGCAQALDRLVEKEPGTGVEDPAIARRRARQSKAAAVAATVAARRSRWVWFRKVGAVVAVVTAVGASWWLFARQALPLPFLGTPQPVATGPAALQAATPEPPFRPAKITATSTQASPEPAAERTAQAVERLRQSVEMLQRQDRRRAAELELQRIKLAQEKQRADDVRRRAEGQAAPLAGADPAAPSSPARQQPTPAPAVSAPTVDQLCAGNGNVFSRDFCRLRECNKTAFANDAVCVRFRQMDQARRLQAEGR